MFYSKIAIALIMSSSFVLAQTAKAMPPTALNAPTTLPIVFTKSVSANHSHPGDPVFARTSQVVRLANGFVVPAGAKITGRVTDAKPFIYDNTPYAQQKQAALSLRFDSIEIDGAALPLVVTVRAMADPITSWGAREPKSSDLDPLSTVSQIGGDQLTPSQSQVVNGNGDVVAYNKRGGIYAHLIANGRCDSSDVEVSIGIYSASACGLYGFTDVSPVDLGSTATPSTITLVSSRTSPKVWRYSTALLEVVSRGQALATR